MGNQPSCRCAVTIRADTNQERAWFFFFRPLKLTKNLLRFYCDFKHSIHLLFLGKTLSVGKRRGRQKEWCSFGKWWKTSLETKGFEAFWVVCEFAWHSISSFLDQIVSLTLCLIRNPCCRRRTECWRWGKGETTGLYTSVRADGICPVLAPLSWQLQLLPFIHVKKGRQKEAWRECPRRGFLFLSCRKRS